jgi:hypothetical protein
MLPGIQKNTALFEGFETLPDSASEKRSIKVNTSMKHWWKILEEKVRIIGRQTCPRHNLSTTNRVRTRASVIRGRLPTAWVKARPEN